MARIKNKQKYHFLLNKNKYNMFDTFKVLYPYCRAQKPQDI